MRIASIEPLRGLAALWLFAFHFPFSPATTPAAPALIGFAAIGHLGVPMFFVLSGYCIAVAASATIRSKKSTGEFLVRRLRRIYPPFWLSILVVASLPFLQELLSSLKMGHYVPPSSDNLNYGFLRFGALDWLNVASLMQVFADVPSAPNLQYKFTGINAVYWTLAIEVQFYLVVTVALVFRRYYFPILGLVTVLSLAVDAESAAPNGFFLSFWPMFAMGTVIHALHERNVTLSRMNRYRGVGAAALIAFVTVAAFGSALLEDRPNELKFAAGFAAILFLLEGLDSYFVNYAVRSPFRIVRLPTAAICLLGTMSYSLYLLHGRLQFLSLQIVRQVIPNRGIVLDGAAIILTCLICFAFYWTCERPFIGSRGKASQPADRTPQDNLALSVS